MKCEIYESIFIFQFWHDFFVTKKYLIRCANHKIFLVFNVDLANLRQKSEQRRHNQHKDFQGVPMLVAARSLGPLIIKPS